MSSHLRPKLLRRFYEVLVLLRVLGQVQGPPISGQPVEEENFGNIQAVEMRRRVLYHLSIMCDFLKGGDTVTAMAVENVPNGPRYWVAANGHLNKIERFLSEVLHMLKTRASSHICEENSPLFEENLFEKFVRFQRARIKQYWRLLQKPIEIELRKAHIRLGERNIENTLDVRGYFRWLKGFQSPLKTTNAWYELSQSAYEARHSQFLRADFDPLTAQPVMMENDSRTAIRHNIGRLCASRRAAKLLTYATLSHPQLFCDFTLDHQDSAPASQHPCASQRLTLAGISGRMFPCQSPELDRFQEALKILDAKASIMSRILDIYQSKEWQPRVHAELALLEALHDRGCTFFDGDKYIACSKAACFCCYHYICSHPGSFTRPPCHNKVYPNWQPPTLAESIDEIRVHQQREIMVKVTAEIRHAIVGKVLNTHENMKWHPDSSTGITTLVATGAAPGTGHDNTKTPEGPSTEEIGNASPQLQAESSAGEDSEDGGVTLGLVPGEITYR